MARPTNKEAFAARANADRLLRKEFETLNAALLEWEAGSASFANVLAAIDAIDHEYQVSANAPIGVGKGEGPASLLGAATRLRDLSAAHSKLLEIAGRVDALKVAARDQLAVAASELAKERRQHMPDYMAQLVNAILAQGVTQQDIGVPSKKLAQHVVSAIREYRTNRQPPLPQADVAHEVLPPEPAIEGSPEQASLPSESGNYEIPYAHIWRELPSEFLGVQIAEEAKEPGVAYASLPCFATIDEFVKPGLPLSPLDGTKASELERNAFYLLRHYLKDEPGEPLTRLGIASSWALLLAQASQADRDIMPEGYKRFRPIQSPWHADRVIRFSPITSPE